MQEHADIIFANEAFYVAFQMKDLEAMEGLWAQAAPVACTHPGWPCLNGREQVLKSWRAIFENPDAVAVTCRAAKARRYGDTAFVTCYEVIGENLLAATNVFVREEGAWRMVHHQAGPCHVTPPELGEDDEEEEAGRLQ
ncbi:nuclear transport factor 2 family protein [Pelagibius sp. CAU 1746]|uniref:nuclear transport factor 2 family protein n=1 Tax=Pelagibius sp. CAU 1746 TaxID=3140370 RepID=UPI00325A83C6